MPEQKKKNNIAVIYNNLSTPIYADNCVVSTTPSGKLKVDFYVEYPAPPDAEEYDKDSSKLVSREVAVDTFIRDVVASVLLHIEAGEHISGRLLNEGIRVKALLAEQAKKPQVVVDNK